MDKNVILLLGAVGALAGTVPADGAAAARVGQTPAASYADLLRPIPNARAVLEAENAAALAVPETDTPVVEEAQFFPHHHHHHHHHRYYRHRRYYHHHHHRYY